VERYNSLAATGVSRGMEVGGVRDIIEETQLVVAGAVEVV
jgi:hypothetical protein